MNIKCFNDTISNKVLNNKTANFHQMVKGTIVDE
jgi:hypothetical protein